MRIFVTGATGVIGTRAVPRLLEAGHQVTALSGPSRTVSTWTPLGVTPSAADLLDVASLRRAFANHDAVIRLATAMPGSAKQMPSPWAWKTSDRIRREGSRALAAAARAEGVPRRIQDPGAARALSSTEPVDREVSCAVSRRRRPGAERRRSAPRTDDSPLATAPR